MKGTFQRDPMRLHSVCLLVVRWTLLRVKMLCRVPTGRCRGVSRCGRVGRGRLLWGCQFGGFSYLLSLYSLSSSLHHGRKPREIEYLDMWRMSKRKELEHTVPTRPTT